jgi:hypothetical protein
MKPLPAHPRTLGWIGTTALAMGGSNQSLFILSALLIGQGNIPGHGSAAILLLVFGLLLARAAPVRRGPPRPASKRPTAATSTAI